MTITAIYPGTFDPITYGHIDLIKKSLKRFTLTAKRITKGVKKTKTFDSSCSFLGNSFIFIYTYIVIYNLTLVLFKKNSI